MATVPAPRRGEIWLVDFDPAVGAEIRKLRPALVISVDAIGRLPPRIIVPVTDWKTQYAHYPWFVELPASPSNGLAKHSGQIIKGGVIWIGGSYNDVKATSVTSPARQP
jgi:mRNA-degrading endonuclease toxin of MazEF toxin-antitoxin module